MGIFRQLKEKVTQYIDVYVNLFKLDFIGRTANILSYFIFLLIGLFLVFCMLLFVGFGLSETIIMMGLSRIASFFIVIGFYLLLLFALVALRKNITRFFASGIIRVMTEGDEGPGEEE